MTDKIPGAEEGRHDRGDAILLRLKQRYDEQQIPNRWIPPDEETPYSSLIIRFDSIGEEDHMIDLELCFLPGLEEFDRVDVAILQSFAVISDDVPSGARSAVLEEAAQINPNLVVGSFGIMQETGALYFKHNALFHLDWLAGEDGPLQIDRQNALILHQFHLFTDRLLSAARRD